MGSAGSGPPARPDARPAGTGGGARPRAISPPTGERPRLTAPPFFAPFRLPRRRSADERRSARDFGRSGEDAAVEHLAGKGLVVVERGYRHRRGEIDIVARTRRGTLVFVEVKTRRNERFGRPEEHVTPAKQVLIRRTARGYLFERKVRRTPCRFDVVSVLPDGRGGWVIRHFEDAF